MKCFIQSAPLVLFIFSFIAKPPTCGGVQYWVACIGIFPVVSGLICIPELKGVDSDFNGFAVVVNDVNCGDGDLEDCGVGINEGNCGNGEHSGSVVGVPIVT